MLLNGGELDGVRILSPTTIWLMPRNQMPRDNQSGSCITTCIIAGQGWLALTSAESVKTP